jgi:hypothetical protein
MLGFPYGCDDGTIHVIGLHNHVGTLPKWSQIQPSPP